MKFYNIYYKFREGGEVHTIERKPFESTDDLIRFVESFNGILKDIIIWWEEL
jgi:hypothetical protein